VWHDAINVPHICSSPARIRVWSLRYKLKLKLTLTLLTLVSLPSTRDSTPRCPLRSPAPNSPSSPRDLALIIRPRRCWHRLRRRCHPRVFRRALHRFFGAAVPSHSALSPVYSCSLQLRLLLTDAVLHTPALSLPDLSKFILGPTMTLVSEFVNLNTRALLLLPLTLHNPSSY
jgi:hypothetical protein